MAREAELVTWLVPIAVFWPLAAMYLGGAPITLEGDGAVRQTVGLLLHFGLYLGAYALLGTLLSGPVGPVLGGIVVPVVVASALLPLLGRLAFRAVGTRIAPASGVVPE